MNKYYCISCAKSQGIYNPSSFNNLFTPPYQLGKFIKHTVPKSCSGPLSVFSNPTTKAYEEYVVSSINSCGIQVDTRSRTNLIWIASEKTGVKYINGSFCCDTDAVKVVLHDNKFDIHAFPVPSPGFNSESCSICGKPVPGEL